MISHLRVQKILNLQCVGFRNLESSKGFVEKPSDLKGLKVRVTGSDVYINTWNTWGCKCTDDAR